MSFISAEDIRDNQEDNQEKCPTYPKKFALILTTGIEKIVLDIRLSLISVSFISEIFREL